MDKRPFCQIDIPTLKAAWLCSSKEETRYYLEGVHVVSTAEATRYAATDGHRLFVRRLTTHKDRPNTLIGSWIIPRTVIPRFSAKKPILAHSELHLVAGDETLQILELQAEYFRPVEGEFPDWLKIIPKKPLSGTRKGVDFNAEYVLAFHKIGKALGIGLPVLYTDDGNPAIVRFTGDKDTLGVIMPFRADREPLDKLIPDWIENMRQPAEEAETVNG